MEKKEKFNINERPMIMREAMDIDEIDNAEVI